MITSLRIFIAFIIFLLISLQNNYFLALILFFIASITDYLDGYLARKYKLVSDLGEILDPLADKVLIVFVLIALAINLSSYLIGFAASLIIARDLFVSSLRDMNSRRNNTSATKVTFLAKIKTSIQLFTILVYLLALSSNKMLLIIFGDIFIILSTFVTLYTGYIYFKNSFKEFS